MLNTLIYRKLTRFASTRTDLVAELPDAGRASIETLRDGTECVHLIGSISACKAVLSDDQRFGPSPIAEAVRIIGERFGLEVDAANEFLRENPMQLTDDAHAERRRQHLSHYAATLRKASDTFPPIADARLAALADSPPRSLTRDLVEPFIDEVLQNITALWGVAPEVYACMSKDNHVLLEHVHHPRKLEQKSRQISDFSTSAGSQDNILLSYILQGRDPMIGGIAAFLHHLFRIPAAARADALASATAARLYRVAAPVNYIGRVARESVCIDGIDIAQGDHLLMLLPSANGDPAASSDARGVAFGAGDHTCAGQAMALSITDAFLAALRHRHQDVDWSMLQPDIPTTAVFRQYKAQS